jgi:hypothetical protein
MTDKDFYIMAGYLANPIRQSLIEVEIPAKDKSRFENDYTNSTGNYPLPIINNKAPYYIWPNGTNKWGIEARLYFISNTNLPQTIHVELEPNKFQNRPGYNNWKRRMSKKDHIYRLFTAGFVLGTPQDENRIRAFIPQQFIGDFNYGYNL